MCLKKIAFSVFLLCAFAATATAQNQTIEYGSADELKDVEKIFVDTKEDMVVRDDIIAEIRKNLLAVKRDLKIVSKPEESDIHLRFYYETQSAHGGNYPGGTILKEPVGTVVKILSKDRMRLLMSYSARRTYGGVIVGLGIRKPEIVFAREFAKAYLAANSPKQGQPIRHLSSR